MNAKDANKIAAEALAKKQREKECREALTREQEKQWQASRPFRVRLEADEIIRKISQEAAQGLYTLVIKVGYPEVQQLLEADGYSVRSHVVKKEDQVFGYENGEGGLVGAGTYTDETYLTISWS